MFLFTFLCKKSRESVSFFQTNIENLMFFNYIPYNIRLLTM